MFGIDPMEWASFKVMMRRFGFWRAIRLALQLKRRVGVGEPYAALGPAQDAKDAESRDQIAPAMTTS